MDVVLLERIEKLGQMGDVVAVKPGFARNYLLPTKKALRATKENLANFESQRHQLEADNLKRRDEASTVADRLNGLKATVIRSAGETGQLYGSVNARDIAKVVTEAGFTVSRDQVVLDRPVKTLGLFDMRIRLHPEVDSTIKVNVARNEDEAAEQERLGRAILSMAAEEDAAEAELAAKEAARAAETMFDPEAREQAEAAATGVEDAAVDESPDQEAAPADTGEPEIDFGDPEKTE